jgi:hypothetical protein
VVDRLPALAGVVCAECARSRDGGEDPVRVARVQKYRVQAHPAGPGRPGGPRAVAAQSRNLMPVLAAIGATEQRGVFNTGVNSIRIGERRFEMPDALELPGVGRAIVPLVRGQRFSGFRRSVVSELVALALGHAVWCCDRFAGRRSGLVPGLAAVVGALNDLPEPATRLRRIQPIRVSGRSLEVVDLPARELWAADFPPFALTVRGQNKRALACANQHSYSAHTLLLPVIRAAPVAKHFLSYHFPHRGATQSTGPRIRACVHPNYLNRFVLYDRSTFAFLQDGRDGYQPDRDRFQMFYKADASFEALIIAQSAGKSKRDVDPRDKSGSAPQHWREPSHEIYNALADRARYQ